MDSSLAQDDDSDSEVSTTSIPQVEYTPCADEIIATVLDKEGELVGYISEKFQEEKFNSEIIADVYDAFDEALNFVNQKKAEKLDCAKDENGNDVDCEKPYSYTVDQYIGEKNTCELIIDQHFNTIESLIATHNAKTAPAKASYVLVRKLIEINDGLREMNRSFGELYAGFKTLSDNLPGITD